MGYIQKKKNVASLNSFMRVGDRVYLSNLWFNCCIVYNMKKRAVERVEPFKNMSASAFAYHKNCVEQDGILYFYPDLGYGVHAYNTHDSTQRFFDLGPFRAGFAYIYKDTLFLLPTFVDQNLASIDLRNGQIRHAASWWSISKLTEISDKTYLISGQYRQDCAWSQHAYTNELFITDFGNKSVVRKTIDIGQEKLFGIQFDGTDFWVTAIGDTFIYRWNVEDGIVSRFDPHINIIADYAEGMGSPYRRVICAGDYIFVIPYHENVLYAFDKTSNERKLESRFPKDALYPATKWWGVKEKKVGQTLYLFCDFTDVIIKINLENLGVEYLSTQIRDDILFDRYVESIWPSILQEMAEEKYRVEQHFDWKRELPHYLEFVCQLPSLTKKTACSEAVGNAIYQRIRGNI